MSDVSPARSRGRSFATQEGDIIRIAALTLIAISLAACGGSDSSATAPTTTAASKTTVSSTTDAPTTTIAPTTSAPPTTLPPIVGEPQIESYATPYYPGDGKPTFLESVTAEVTEGRTRIVFEFDGGTPEFHIEYVEVPVLAAPSGKQLELDGEAALMISMAPASGVDLGSNVPLQVYDGPDSISVAGEVVKEIAKAEDWESHMTWVIGLEEQLPFSFSTMTDPARLVIDLHQAELTAVADYSDGERAFTVEAFVTPADTCVAVHTKRATTKCVASELGYAVEHQLVRVDGLDIMVGIVSDPAIADIDLVAFDGSLIPEDDESFSLVDIGNGLRMFAPRIDPAQVREIMALSADGTVLLQAQVKV